MIVLFSSFLSPHIKPLCDELYALTNKEFCYVATSKVTEERKKLGYEYSENIPYFLDLSEDKNRQQELAYNADCVIINTGSADIDIVSRRLQQNKLTFYLNERIFKRGILKLLDPKLWKLLYFNLKYRNCNTYLLCLGNAVRKDFERIAFCKNHSFKFGYFPVPTEENKQNTLQKEKNFVWVARMIDWKRPLFAVKTVQLLNKRGINCRLDMLGDGPLFEKVKEYIQKHNLDNTVTLHGNTENKLVREYMQNSSLLLFTSNKREGWGAVANEALSAGLPVAASRSIGCTGYLVNEQNGVLFKTHSPRDAAKQIERMLGGNYEKYCENAKQTMNIWNAKVAAQRLCFVINEICEKGSLQKDYSDGPMSKA